MSSFNKKETLILETDSFTCKVKIGTTETVSKAKPIAYKASGEKVMTIDMPQPDILDTDIIYQLSMTDNAEKFFLIDLSEDQFSAFLHLLAKCKPPGMY